MKRSWALLSCLLSVVLVAGVAACDTPEKSAEDLGHVAILVIDDFQKVRSGPEKPENDANCSYSPESVNEVGSGGVSGDGLPEGVSHGEAVTKTLLESLSPVPGLAHAAAAPNPADYGLAAGSRLDVWKYGGHEVVVVGVDTDKFTTATINQRINDTVLALEGSKRQIKRFVINMSFVIAPCNVAAWLDQKLDVKQVINEYKALLEAHPELEDLKRTLEKLTSSSDAEARAIITSPAPEPGVAQARQILSASQFYGSVKDGQQLPEAIKARLWKDPILDGVAKLSTSSRRVIPVGAAGNGVFTLVEKTFERVIFPFPFAPAIWDSVVSVSAGVTKPESYSNSGEMMLDGSTTLTIASTGTPVRGTSFAAPRLSAKLARHLLTGGKPTCDGHTPTLGYATATPPWLNEPFDTRATAYCRGLMVGPLPSPT